jgi:hypothetical protein
MHIYIYIYIHIYICMDIQCVQRNHMFFVIKVV